MARPKMLELFGNQSCGHQAAADMCSACCWGARARPDEQVVKVFPALLVRIVCDDTSQLVAWRRPIVLAAMAACSYHWALIGHAAMVRRMATSSSCSVWEAERHVRAASGLRLVCGSSMVWHYLAYECIG